jgi:hypothetical protein
MKTALPHILPRKRGRENMPVNIGIRPVGQIHEIFVGERTLSITDSQLLILSRSLPIYFRLVLSKRRLSSSNRQDISPIAPIPVRNIRLNEDLLETQVHMTIEDILEGVFDYALDPGHARHLGERLIARATQIEAAARGQQSH